MTRERSWNAVTVLIALAVEMAVLWPRGGLERQFIPGPLGHVAGYPDIRMYGGTAGAPETGYPGYLTRTLLGVDAQWARSNGLTSQLSFSHNLAQVFPASLYRQHPEFFPLVNGTRLEPQAGRVNWNPDLGRPDVAEHAGEVAREYVTVHPDAESFSLGVNDGLIFGESPETLALVSAGGEREWGQGRRASGEERMPESGESGSQPSAASHERAEVNPPSAISHLPSAIEWFRGRPDYSDLVFTFMNRAAGELARTNPGKYLGALAYYWAENAPDFPVDPQVAPFLTADRSQGYDPAFKAEEFALQERWAARLGAARETGDSADTGPMADGGEAEKSGTVTRASGLSGSRAVPRLQPRLGLYDYLYGSGFLIPRIHTRLIAENLRHARRAGFVDYFAEANPNWGLDGPQPWLVAQLLQDPEQPAEALLDEYYRRYFQGAAAPMRRFFERCEEQWMHQSGPSYWLKHFRDESQADVFPPAVCRELRGLLDKAALVAGHEGAVAARVRLVSDAFGATERFVAFQESREALNRLALQGVEGEGRGTRDGKPDGPKAGAPVPRPSGLSVFRPSDITAALAKFLDAREEFVGYVQALASRQPLALAPFDLIDYTNHDPVVNALMAIAASARRPEELKAGMPALTLSSALTVRLPRNWDQLTKGDTDGWRDVCRNGSVQGPVIPARTIAGLEYGVALPAEWISKVEPAERHRAILSDISMSDAGGRATEDAERVAGDRLQEPDNGTLSTVHGPQSTEPRILRISGTTDTAVFQWNAVEGNAFYLAQVAMRGRVGPGCAATLTIGWLDANAHNLGYSTMRLPEGDWSASRVLSQGGFPPAGAAYVGMGVRIQHQTADDWIEVSNFRLKTSAKRAKGE